MTRPHLTIPPAATGLLAVMVFVQIVRMILPEEYDLYLLYFLGFHPFRTGSFEIVWVYGAFTSQFVHAGWLHLLANGIWVVALSPRISDFLDTGRFLVLFVVSGICGALTHAVINWGEPQFLVGASGAVFGLLGAAAHVPGKSGDRHGRPTLRHYLHYVLVMMLIMNLAFALISGASISWEAHAGGFFAGLALFPVLRRVPGRPSRE